MHSLAGLDSRTPTHPTESRSKKFPDKEATVFRELQASIRGEYGRFHEETSGSWR